MRFLRVFVLALLIPSAALADPILLADYQPPVIRRTSCCPTQLTFDIGWSGSATEVGLLFGNDDPDTFGFRMEVGTTGTFDFTAANAPGFDALAARLTDSSDGHLIFHFGTVVLNDRIPDGETAAFGDLLTGNTIDFLRLVIKQNDIVQDGTGYVLEGEWQVWGHSPTSVPVSGTLTLLGIGLSLALLRRRRDNG